MCSSVIKARSASLVLMTSQHRVMVNIGGIRKARCRSRAHVSPSNSEEYDDLMEALLSTNFISISSFTSLRIYGDSLNEHLSINPWSSIDHRMSNRFTSAAIRPPGLNLYIGDEQHYPIMHSNRSSGFFFEEFPAGSVISCQIRLRTTVGPGKRWYHYSLPLARDRNSFNIIKRSAEFVDIT
jgi:hypothetical protein